MVGRTQQIKELIVADDPQEPGIGKALGVGHAVGLPLESITLAERRIIDDRLCNGIGLCLRTDPFRHKDRHS
jgi:3-dehydroquinate synthetase